MYTVHVDAARKHYNNQYKLIRVMVRGLHPSVPEVRVELSIPIKDLVQGPVEGHLVIRKQAFRTLLKHCEAEIASNYSYMLGRTAHLMGLDPPFVDGDWYWNKVNLEDFGGIDEEDFQMPPPAPLPKKPIIAPVAIDPFVYWANAQGGTTNDPD